MGIDEIEVTESLKETPPSVAPSTPSTEPASAAPESRYRPERRYYKEGERGERGERSDNKDGRKKFFKRKVCHFCKNNLDVLDYKDVKLLKRYVKESGKLIPKRLTGTCSKHQRVVTRAVKRARNVAILPYEMKY